MKRYTLALLITSSVALAGDPGSAKSAKGAKGPIVQPPAPTISWFAGASGGYLLDNESAIGTAHIGVDLPHQVAGFDQAIYLEAGWTECGDDFVIARQHQYGDKKYDRSNHKGGNGRRPSREVDTDLQIVPITLNYKLEREIAHRLKAYLGAGAGIAWVDGDARGAISGDDQDWIFFGQVFAGLLYEVTENFEIYAGVRGIYMDEPDLEVSGFDIGENATETDLLIEGGGRLNF